MACELEKAMAVGVLRVFRRLAGIDMRYGDVKWPSVLCKPAVEDCELARC